DGTAMDPQHVDEASMLGGFTLFGALTPGGPALGSVALPWPPPVLEYGSPGFSIPNVPDGTFYVAVVKGLVQSAVIPPAHWSQVTVSYASCGSAPGTPTNFRRSTGGQANLVLLFWDLAPGCQPESMQIETGSTPGAADIGIFQVPVQSGWGGVAPPGIYYIRVRAKNRSGVSALSNEIQVIVNDPNACTGPSAPQNLTFSLVGNQLTLNWQPPATSGSRPLSFYQISAGTTPGAATFGYVRVTATSLVASNVPSGTYFVRVQAGNTCSQAAGAPSNEVMVVVP
ncbi:MAG TPA: fibronectin type III domain-containing protein, partial [Vicinamibacterales bacterium]|nr:fibronectin type III domain-containing protein [Vicinamibacterales bacterium]